MKLPTATAKQGYSLWTLSGCGCGLLGVIGIMLVFFALGVQTVRERQNPAWNRKDYTVCQEHLNYLREALHSYQADHHHLPKTLNELQPRYLDTPQRLHCPVEACQGHAYRYTPNNTTSNAPLITCNNHALGRLALLRNGQILYGLPEKSRKNTPPRRQK